LAVVEPCTIVMALFRGNAPRRETPGRSVQGAGPSWSASRRRLKPEVAAEDPPVPDMPRRAHAGSRPRGRDRSEPLRPLDTIASNGLAAGVTVFELARVMGTSVRMIERHYGTLIGGAHAGIAGRLDALEAELVTSRSG
jgi:hypothetical protein